MHYLRDHGAQNVELFVVAKGRDYFRRLGTLISKEHTNIFNNLSFAHAELITKDLVDAYLRNLHPPLSPKGRGTPLVAVDLLYNETKSVHQQQVVVDAWLEQWRTPPAASFQTSFMSRPRSSFWRR